VIPLALRKDIAVRIDLEATYAKATAAAYL
jgi:hypothetical protein